MTLQVFDSVPRGSQKPMYFEIRDRHYLSLWDAKDLSAVEKWQAKIRATHDEQLILDFFNNLNRKWDDHRSNLIIEPHQVSKKDDILTYKGIAQFCRFITGQDLVLNRGFRYVVVGSAGSDNRFLPFNDSLVAEEGHVSFETNGFFDAVGTSIRYGGTFSQNMITETYSESLVRSTANFSDPNMTVMCLNNFGDDPINHTSGNTGFTAAGSVEFAVIADD